MKIKLQQTITMKVKSLNKFAFLVSLLLIVSCDGNKVYDEYVAINSEGWIITETIDFSVELNSTQADLYDVLIGLRNNNDYLYSNLFLFVEVENPIGETTLDTLQYLLAEPNGSWIGNGVGSIKHNLFKYKESQNLQEGIYKFKIRHGMRSNILLGLEDIGVRIEIGN